MIQWVDSTRLTDLLKTRNQVARWKADGWDGGDKWHQQYLEDWANTLPRDSTVFIGCAKDGLAYIHAASEESACEKAASWPEDGTPEARDVLVDYPGPAYQ